MQSESGPYLLRGTGDDAFQVDVKRIHKNFGKSLTGCPDPLSKRERLNTPHGNHSSRSSCQNERGDPRKPRCGVGRCSSTPLCVWAGLLLRGLLSPLWSQSREIASHLNQVAGSSLPSLHYLGKVVPDSGGYCEPRSVIMRVRSPWNRQKGGVVLNSGASFPRPLPIEISYVNSAMVFVRCKRAQSGEDLWKETAELIFLTSWLRQEPT